MNKFIQTIKDVDVGSIKALLQKESKWIKWSEPSGKNALHYLCGLDMSKDALKIEAGFQLLKLLLSRGMDINSIHQISEEGGFFPATPLWYAYTRGRNEKLFTYLLKKGADPNHCMFAIAWYDDVKSANLFKKYGAAIDDASGGNTPFLAAFQWKKFDMAEWFLKKGANVNYADPQGNTALYFAVKRKYEIEHIRRLLTFGAEVNKENNKGISPKQLAESNHQRNILSLF